MASYRERVLRDMAQWQRAGWITPEQATTIAASLPKRRFQLGFSAIIAMLGAILFSAGIISFIAANWDGIPRIGRLGITAFIMAAAYMAAALLRRATHPFYAETALVIGAAGFAAALALTGQIYNMTDGFIDLIGWWTAGVFAAAVLLASSVMAILALAGAVVWTLTATSYAEFTATHWPALGAILAGGVLAAYLQSPAARILAAIALLVWMALTLGVAANTESWNPATVMTAAAAASAAVLTAALFLSGATAIRPHWRALGRAALWPTLVALLLALGILQVAEERLLADQTYLQWLSLATVATLVLGFVATRNGTMSLPAFLTLVGLGAATLAFARFLPADRLLALVGGSVIVIIATIWAVQLGRAGLMPAGTQTGLTAFGLEVLYVYVMTVGTILDTAVVYLIGGILLILLALSLYQIERRLRRKGSEAAL
ncbi:MAG: DUF2157 domain-containing protein [Alphaproteobacteria bacterium]